MIRTVIAATTIIALTTFSASAADLFIPDEPLPILADSPFDWSGAYIGASVGGQGVTAVGPGQATLSGTAVVGGVFGGFNFQSGNLVYGIEADAEYSGFNATVPCTNPAWSCNGYLNAQGSLRARLGYAVESLLFYGTAGVAVGHAGGSTTSPANVVFPDSSVRVGWTVGAGVEAAFTDNWFGRVEYRYTNFGADNLMFDVPYNGVEVSSHAVRAGIGYKF
jgi:outer membrane immunogenic protein